MNSGSGKREKVMIACVTFETVKVTEPVRYYECNRVHIIHYVKDTGPNRNVFMDFYGRVCEIIRTDNRNNIEIIEHHGSVSNFSRMLALILSIIEQEKDNDVYINISAGSPEYSAAAAIGAMMSENVLPFSVNSKEYTVGSEELIRSAYYRENKPVGLTAATFEPRALPHYSIDKPEEHLVRGLRILNEFNENKKRTKSSSIVPVLKEKGIWYRDESDSNQKQSDAVNFHRDFVSKWIDNGWVEKDELRKRFVLTEEGKNIIGTFYINDN